jgi:hypothetical protein
MLSDLTMFIAAIIAAWQLFRVHEAAGACRKEISRAN